MRPLAKLSASFFGMGLSLLLLMCKKDNAPTSIVVNHPPIANAGADITLERLYCSSPNSVQLDGSSSSDADYDKLAYKWTRISGPSSSLFDADSLVAYANDLQVGQYTFELGVTDPKGLSSKDTVVVSVSGSPLPTEVDLDVNLDGNYNFRIGLAFDEVYLCQVLHLCPSHTDEARTNFITTFDLPTWGKFIFRIDETADTSAGSNNHQTSVALTSANIHFPSGIVWGTSSINFKQLIQAGGGAFNGTFEIDAGTADGCDPNIFANVSPLAISGTLDAGTRTMSLTLKGKVYF